MKKPTKSADELTQHKAQIVGLRAHVTRLEDAIESHCLLNASMSKDISRLITVVHKLTISKDP